MSVGALPSRGNRRGTLLVWRAISQSSHVQVRWERCRLGVCAGFSCTKCRYWGCRCSAIMYHATLKGGGQVRKTGALDDTETNVEMDGEGAQLTVEQAGRTAKRLSCLGQTVAMLKTPWYSSRGQSFRLPATCNVRRAANLLARSLHDYSPIIPI